MEWLIYLTLSTMVLVAVLVVFVGVFETLKEIAQDNPGMIGVAKAASFVLGLGLASFGWLGVVMLPFWGVWIAVAMFMATVVAGVGLATFARS
jgi:hypothetical protein